MSRVVAAAIYARISSDQDGSGLGVARQLKDCRALASSRGWSVVEEFVDNDVSAFSGRSRPQYERLLTLMGEGRVNAVLVYHLDRLTRRPKELEEFVELCDRVGITDLATVSGDVNLGTGDGLLIARIGAAVAANESAAKSRRIRRKLEQVAESGMPHGGSTRPFGYQQDRITIDKAEAKVIRQCAARLIAGESLRSVTAWLDATEVPTVNGAPWRTQTVRLMMLNPRLVGLRTHRGEVVGPAVWKPILTPTQQQQIAARIHARTTSGRRAPRRYVLSGMLRCGKCGGTLYSAARQESRRYVCLSGPDHRGCGRLTVVAQPVEELITDAVLFRLDSPELAAALRGGDGSTHSTALAEELAADEAQRDELAALYAAKAITAKEWMTARNPIEARIQRGRAQIAEHVNATALIDLIGTGAELRTHWSTLNLDRQAAIIRTVVDHIVILPGTNGARSLDINRVQPHWLL
jgi:DNA invertase Pin-like site-specific DNA recombinase